MKADRLTVHKARNDLPQILRKYENHEWFLLLRIDSRGRCVERTIFQNHRQLGTTIIPGFTHYVLIP